MAIVLRSAYLYVPNTKPLRDGLIAATALVHRMTVVTRNVDDYKMAGVKILTLGNKWPPNVFKDISPISLDLSKDSWYHLSELNNKTIYLVWLGPGRDF